MIFGIFTMQKKRHVQYLLGLLFSGPKTKYLIGCFCDFLAESTELNRLKPYGKCL